MAILESRTHTGISWVKESVALFKQQPQKWLLLALAYVIIFMMLPSIAALGFLAIFTVIIWPVFTAFAVMLYRSADYGKNESLETLFNQVKPHFKNLMTLGLLALVYVTITSLLLNSDMQSMMAFIQQKAELTEDQYTQFAEKFIPFMGKLMLILIPMFMATWYSPMLISLNQYSVVNAIKSSIAGVLQYIVSLIVAWLVLTSSVMLVMMVLGLVLGITGLAKFLFPLLFFAILLISTAMVFAFQYVSYRDIFRAAPTTAKT
jgi:hypothetical protein